MLSTYVVFFIIFALLSFFSFTHERTRSLFVPLSGREFVIALVFSLGLGLFWPVFIAYLIVRWIFG